MLGLPKVDMDYVVKLTTELLNTPSPSGYSDEVMRIIDRELASMGLPFVETNRGARIATMKGKADAPQRLLSGHVDTLGGMVKEIKANGRLKYVPISGGASPDRRGRVLHGDYG